MDSSHSPLDCLGTPRRSRITGMLALFSVVMLNHASASSRSSPRRPTTSNPRRKKRKKRRDEPRKDTPDPHDVSSSSPSFLPLVFSDDEREEDILSALARLEVEEDDEQQEEIKQKQKLKKTKGIVKKAMSEVMVEQKGKERKTEQRDKVKEENMGPTNDVYDKASVDETKGTPVKEMSTPSSVQPSLTALEAIRRSPPRQNFAQAQYPPRPTWTRPQQQPLRNHPPVTPVSTGTVPPSTRTVPGSGVRTPQSAYPYAPPPGTVTQPQPKPSRQQVDASTTRWIRKFLSARPKDTLLPIPREYLSDGFNLVQLAPIVEQIVRAEGVSVPPAAQRADTFPLFKAALRLILSNDNEPTSSPVQRAAEVLYTLVHARYVISPRGLDTVRRVLRRSDGTVDPVFGRCPRIRCRGMPLLPCGDTDNYDPRNSMTTRAKRYCSCCGEKFYTWDSKADESAWGPSFCHLFLMIYGSAVFPNLHKTRAVGNSTTMDPSIFGFKVHPVAQLRYSVRDS